MRAPGNGCRVNGCGMVVAVPGRSADGSACGAVGAGDQFEFLNTVDRWLQSERVLVVIVVIHAVDEIAVELFATPAGMHGESASLGQFGILDGGRHAGREERQLQKIAAVE